MEDEEFDVLVMSVVQLVQGRVSKAREEVNKGEGSHSDLLAKAALRFSVDDRETSSFKGVSDWRVRG